MASSPGTTDRPAWVTDVLRFWFEDTPREAWFQPNAVFDGHVRATWSALHDDLSRSDVDSLSADAEMALAAIVVLDQFPRNMYRGHPKAFETDALALSVADRALAKGFDQNVAPDYRIFFYLPFEHSETIDDQARSVALCTAHGDENYLRYAIAHQVIIARFGRFPHRNAVLGRPSTAEEIAFLEEPGSAF